MRAESPVFRLLETPPAPGAWNMAVDAALMESIRAGSAPVLRFYRWAPACLSLGRNQPARGCYDADAVRRAGLDVVRRPTGGRAVLHDRELTYSVLVRQGVLGSARECYAAINRALVAGLRQLGVSAELQPRTAHRASVPSLAPCFREPAEGEIVVSGRKLVGSAQVRERGVVLQHGSLLLDDDQARVRELLRTPVAEAEGAAPIGLSALCDPLPSWQAVTEALVHGWQEELGVRLTPDHLTPAEHASATDLAAHFRNRAWTWSR